MRGDSSFVAKDLVLVGGGHSHVEVLRSFGMKPVEGVRVTLITRDVHTPYSGMLPGYVSGFYQYDDCHIDLSKLCAWAGVRLVHEEAETLDLKSQLVRMNGRPPIPYDALSIDIGIIPALGEVPGAKEYTTPVKPIDRFVKKLDALVARASQAERQLRIVVVGGGAGGVEVALALQYRLTRERSGHTEADIAPIEFTIVSRTPILATQAGYARRALRRIIAEKGVVLREGSAVESVGEGQLTLQNGEQVGFDECLWCTHAAPAPWIRDCGLPTDTAGFVAVDATLQCRDLPGVFAAGDVAACLPHPRPKAGVFAVRQGPPLAENLRRCLTGRSLQPFEPQSSYLSLISTGDRHCVGTKSVFGWQGRWLWTWKDRIDRTFMDKYSVDLPEMAPPATASDPAASAVAAAGPDAMAAMAVAKMRCGGCGSKVGSSSLARVLERLRASAETAERPQDRSSPVLTGLDAPDDAAIVRPPPEGHVMVQTVDFFRSFVSDPFVFGRIAANHALSDCHAMGAAPATALATAVVPYAVEAKMEDELYQMMHGAATVLDAAGCELVGGHSAEGQEMALGFSIYGHCPPARLMRKGGLQPHQALLLTKPVGTGVLLAAAMRGKARGRWVGEALEHMQQSSAAAAAALQDAECSACTDVTGFGLLGHLVEMARASGVAVALQPGAVPVLEGALDCFSEGIFSTLHSQNERAVLSVSDSQQACRHPAWPALIDPQTAGGLLASVPAAHAESCLQRLRDLGYPHAARIGTVLDTRPSAPAPPGSADTHQTWVEMLLD